VSRPIRILLVAATSTALSTAAAQQSASLISLGKADKVAVGMTVEALYGEYGRANLRLIPEFGEGQFYPALQVYPVGEPSVPAFVLRIAEICGRYRVSGITVHSIQYRTRENLGVGSTIGEIRKRFPQSKLNRENAPSVVVDSLQMTFMLATNNFADSVRVESVWMWTTMPDSVTRCR
jgi:hypothetical protein